MKKIKRLRFTQVKYKMCAITEKERRNPFFFPTLCAVFFPIYAFFSCNLFTTNEKSAERELRIAVSDSVMAYDSVIISIWDEQKTSILQEIHNGKIPSPDKIITADINKNVPENYNLIVKGFILSGELVYHKSLRYSNGKNTGTVNILTTAAKFNAEINPKTDTIPAGMEVIVSIYITEDLLNPEYYWFLNGKMVESGKNGILKIESFIQGENKLWARIGNVNGYTYSDTAIFFGLKPTFLAPSNLHPANGSKNQSISVTLMWSEVQGSGAVRYDVKLDTNENPVDIEAEGLTNIFFQKNDLALNTTYYWQVIAHEGNELRKGDIWSFTTSDVTKPDNIPPYIDTPSPADNSVNSEFRGVKLSWRGGDSDSTDLVFFNVYLSKVYPPDSLIFSNITATEVTIKSALKPNTLFYWRVTASDNKDTTEGPIWNFMTKDEIPFIKIIQPQGSIKVDLGVLFLWESSQSIDSVKIEYMPSTINNWLPLPDFIENTGSYQWNIPTQKGNTFRFKISDVSGTAADSTGIITVID